MSGDEFSEFQLREMVEDDFERGFMECLGHLTGLGAPVSRVALGERFRQRVARSFHTFVAIDPRTDTVCGTATLIAEPKFTHSLGMVGHIEDVVVLPAARRARVGAALIAALMSRARELGCYKVILDCKEENVSFYERCGFARCELQMRANL